MTPEPEQGWAWNRVERMFRADARETVLRVASDLTTDKADPDAVAANGAPIRAWVDAADGKADVLARHRAISQHAANLRASRALDSVANDPDGFLCGVLTLYAFLTEAVAS